jgi:hypothetical protein
MRIFYYHKSDGFFWFRIFGYGLVFKDLTKYQMRFSERYEYANSIRIGKWLIRPINPLF